MNLNGKNQHKRPYNRDVIFALAKKTGGQLAYGGSTTKRGPGSAGRVCVKHVWGKTKLYLDYYPSKKEPYFLTVSYRGVTETYSFVSESALVLAVFHLQKLNSTLEDSIDKVLHDYAQTLERKDELCAA